MPASPNPPPNSRDGNFRASHVIMDVSSLAGEPGDACAGMTISMQDGLDVMYLHSSFDSPRKIPVQDDLDRVYFSFNFGMTGGAECRFFDTRRKEFEIRDLTGSIQYGPGRKGIYLQSGELRNLTIMLRPDVLADWAEDLDRELNDMLKTGGFLPGHRGAELASTIQLLSRSLPSPDDVAAGRPPRHPLWLQAQCMAVVGIFLEARGATRAMELRSGDQSRLRSARDRLLADLSSPPSLNELAREVGLSVPTLTRDFRRLYGTSAFAPFQRERMHKARSRLLHGEESVIAVATDLGYTNASHFSAAFRKQFGLLPKEVRRMTSGGEVDRRDD